MQCARWHQAQACKLLMHDEHAGSLESFKMSKMQIALHSSRLGPTFCRVVIFRSLARSRPVRRNLTKVMACHTASFNALPGNWMENP